MKQTKLGTVLTLAVVALMVLTACGAPAAEPTEAPMEEATEAPMEEPTEAMPEAMVEGDPTGQTVVFWNAWPSGANAEGMTAIVDKFNAENEYGITVVQEPQGSQGDLGSAMNGAITTGDLPNVTMGFPNALASYYNLGVVTPLNDYIIDPVYGVDPDVWASILPGAIEGSTLGDGTIIGIPVNQSVGGLFYNTSWASELGFDGPPTSAAELKEQACAAAEANRADDNPDNDDAGYVLYNDASYVLPLIVANGGSFLNADGTGYNLNGPESLEAALFLKDLVDSGCTLTTPSFPNPEFANRLALFAGSSSAGIPFQVSAFAESDYPEDEWTQIAYPGTQGTIANAYTQPAAVITTNADTDLASWIFLSYLTSPEAQAEWVAYTGYMPTQSSTDISAKADDAQWNAAYALLDNSFSEPPLAAHFAVRGLIFDAYNAVVAAADEAEIQAILDQLQADAEAAVAESQ